MLPAHSLKPSPSGGAGHLSSLLFPWFTGTLMASALVVPGAYALLTLWLALYGVWHYKGIQERVWGASREAGGSLIWWGMLGYVAIGVGMGLWRGDKLAYFEAYLPMLLAPFIVNAVIVARPPSAMLWLGAASGAILAGLMASYQSLYLQAGRAGGAMSNVIMFGDLSVALAMFSAFGCLYWPQSRRRPGLRVLLLAGAAMGLWASLLSGSKGGWLSILMLAVVWAWLALAHWHWGRRLAGSVVVMAGILLVAVSLPYELVVGRVVDGFSAGQTWFTTGAVTEASVSIRLEKWGHAIDMVVQRPLAGWGTSGATEELGRRIRDAGVPGHWTQTENDLLQAGINHGIPGLAAYLLLCLGFIAGFALIRRGYEASSLEAGLATIGIVLTLLMLEFGLSIVVMGRNGFRHFFITWGTVCLGYLLLSRQRQSDQAALHEDR